MTPIRIENVSKFFGKTPAVDGVSLDIAAGELFFLLGPSGCGKTTLLRILAGFIQPDAGEVYFADKAVTHLRPQDRDAGMVFQTYALWPHMTVAGNVAYGLHVRGVRRQEVATRVGEALKLVRMDGFEERRPTQLSGGQQQRVALARALVIRPQVLLLDEPLSNLDARLRDEMREEIRRLHEQTKLTMVYVTHDQKEALTLADRLAVMERGRLVQVGKPQEVYNRPLNRFVAGFLGDSNFVVGTVREYAGGRCLVETALGTLAGMPAQAAAAGQQVVCSIRPHALALGQHGTGANQITGKVQQVSYLGEVLHVKVAAGGDTLLDVVSLAHLAGQLRAGDPVSLSVPEDQVVILPDTN
ncbi:MAG: ABC transporter ATP-binding protein [Planctomycetota bacterium]|nr:MAG: ABC transporter ATP-binding protein [Planctomycetota bacterium]